MRSLLVFMCFKIFQLVIGRGRGYRGKGGGFDGVDPSLLDPTSFLPMDSILNLENLRILREREKKIKSVRKRIKATKFGTEFSFDTMEDVKSKTFGLGVGSSFVGMAGMGQDEPNFGFVAGLMAAAIYHRYIFYKTFLHKKGFTSDNTKLEYYNSYYSR